MERRFEGGMFFCVVQGSALGIPGLLQMFFLSQVLKRASTRTAGTITINATKYLLQLVYDKIRFPESSLRFYGATDENKITITITITQRLQGTMPVSIRIHKVGSSSYPIQLEP